MSSLLNKKQVKQFALEAAKTRAHRFTRVGGDFYVKCEGHLRQFIHHHIHRLPSKGKTILRVQHTTDLAGFAIGAGRLFDQPSTIN